ncbi:hypothetical protein OSB04_016956 [Centaurea solstitialis]|uniref:CCHC-type domain-containing protein n=1 Tax=Centaurea solstitialis TaxID=347529 RepID=A0AA38TD17_9ASTR|nr:hypothetical protein OSB04_016956 [Centaurea solstitialis]
MASTVTSTNNLSLRSILEKDKLTGSNFLDWERNLMIVLTHERKWYVLEEPLGEAPPATAPAAAMNAHKKHLDDLLDVACLMLATMSPDLQAGLINTNAYDMIRQLRDMFQTQARTERYDTDNTKIIHVLVARNHATKAFNECKMIKGTSVSDHVMKMKRHLDHLERLGHPVPLQLAIDTILNSLSEDYRPFVVNYNMNNMEKSIAELHSMLKTAELNMGNKNKTKDVLMVRDGGVKKKSGHTSTSKGKGPVQAVQSAPKKGKGKGKGKKVKPNKARTENRCFTCNEVGHWRQNCPKRHEAGMKLVFQFFIQNLSVTTYRGGNPISSARGTIRRSIIGGSILKQSSLTRGNPQKPNSVTSRYQQNPGEPHWVAVKNILKYLRRTKDTFLVFGGSEDEISVNGYSDANSTTVAEYIAASDAAKEAIWLRNFLSDLRVVASVSRPIDIFCDNSGAVAQAKEPREHHKS